MRELSLNVLDICQNSIAAHANNIDIDITVTEDTLAITINDDGKGMSADFLKSVVDPFTTTRTTRKVGLGIPLFKQAAEDANGTFEISSTLGVGTQVKATFERNHIDRMPLGAIEDTLASLILTAPRQNYTLVFTYLQQHFSFSTAEVKDILGEVPIESLEIIAYIKSLISENIAKLTGGTWL